MLKIGELLFRLRDYTPIPFVIMMIIFPSTTVQSLVMGTALMLVGEFIRIKGVSHIGGVSRTRSYSTGKKLITSGPFSIVRNPLYIGNFFLSLGLILIANVHPLFTLLFVAGFILQYIPIVRWEESNLKQVFGREYEDYMKTVPRWIPKLKNSEPHPEPIKPDYASALKSEKNTLAAAVILYFVLLLRSDWVKPVFERLF